MIAAGGEQRRDRQQGEGALLHSLSRATVSAFSAASRRLSATIQNHAARGWLGSAAIAPTLNPLCPAILTLVGGSSGRTSRPASASARASGLGPGFSSNSTHTEKL